MKPFVDSLATGVLFTTIASLVMLAVGCVALVVMVLLSYLHVPTWLLTAIGLFVATSLLVAMVDYF